MQHEQEVVRRPTSAEVCNPTAVAPSRAKQCLLRVTFSPGVTTNSISTLGVNDLYAQKTAASSFTLHGTHEREAFFRCFACAEGKLPLAPIPELVAQQRTRGRTNSAEVTKLFRRDTFSWRWRWQGFFRAEPSFVDVS